MKKPEITSIYSDNGDLSHYALIDPSTGEKIWSESPVECSAMGQGVVGDITDYRQKHAVQIAILNDEGMVLGVSRKDNHEDFGLAGGKVDPEDDFNLYRALLREVKEETGIDIVSMVEVFSMHKDGYMGHTYLATKWTGDISYDKDKEPHVVKWVPFSVIEQGSFGKWNTMVAESLINMGVEFLRDEESR